MLVTALVLAYKQLLHRGLKLIGVLAGVFVAILLMFVQLGFENALYESAIKLPRSMNADLFITSPQYICMAHIPPWFSSEVLTEVAGIDGVASTLPMYILTVNFQNVEDGKTLSAWLLAATPFNKAFLNADINSLDDVLALPETLILDSYSRHDYEPIVKQFKSGKNPELLVTSIGKSLQSSGSIRGLFKLGPTFTIDGTFITSDLNMFRWFMIPSDRISLGMVRLKPGTDPKIAKDAIHDYLGSRASVYTKEEFISNERDFYSTGTPIGFIFRSGLVVGIIVGVVFIFQALLGIINDNIKEYAVLKAMGYSASFFVIQIASISVVISLSTYIPAVIIGKISFIFASDAIKLPLEMSITDLVTVMTIVLGMGLISTALAIRKLQNANPVDLFA